MLRARGGVNADELAISLGVSKQCVRKHLEVLERDGYVHHSSEHRDRGRPANVYSLTGKADDLLPKRYDEFALAILNQVSATWGADGLENVFCGCAAEMIGRFMPELEGLGFDDRVRRLTELLSAGGYQAECERVDTGSFVLTQWNCPASDVAKKYDQMCDRELIAYRELLDADITCESRINTGASRCVYRVKNRKGIELGE